MLRVLILIFLSAEANAEYIPGNRLNRSSDTMRGYFAVGSTMVVTNRSVGIGVVPGTQIAFDIAKSSEASTVADPKAFNIRNWNYTYSGVSSIAGSISSNRIGRATYSNSAGTLTAVEASTLRFDGPPIPAGGVVFNSSHTIAFAHGVDHSVVVENAPALTGGDGSHLFIRGSSGVGEEKGGGHSYGGNISITAGNGTGDGAGGSINLTPGTSESGAAGSVRVLGAFSLTQTTVSVNGANAFFIPSGALMYFNLTSCPNGWSEFTESRGRYVVSRPVSGSTGTVVGTALTQAENRPVGQHSHTITDPGHQHDAFANTNGEYDSGGSDAFYGVQNVNDSMRTLENTTGITINNSGSVAGTNAPYIQLIFCRKD
jgi:hypothetical protein